MVPQGDQSADLTLRVLGPVTDGGRLPLAELARLANGLQASLELLALGIAGKSAGAGRRPREIIEAVRLDFVGFRAGSALLDITRTGQLEFSGGLLDQALNALEEGVEVLRAQPQAPPPFFGPQLMNQLRILTGGIGTGGVNQVELWQGGRARVVLDNELRDMVRRASFGRSHQESTIVGRLHMGDFSPAVLRCRIDTYAGSITCDFDSDLRDVVLDAMDQVVMAEGEAELASDGATIHVLHLSTLRRIPTADPKSIDELAREQGVGPVRSVEDLRVDDPGDMEEFLAALRSARGDDEGVIE